MKINPDRLEQSLAGTLAPVYLVAGPEPLLVQESRDQIIEAAKTRGFLEREVYQVDRSFDWDELRSASMEQSLFSSLKIVDLRIPTGKPGQAGGKALTEWAKSPDADVLLLVSCDTWDGSSRKAKWSTELSKVGVLVEIWPIKPGELPRWISRRMQVAGLKADQNAVLLLAELVEGNLLAAQQEIEKLSLIGIQGVVTANVIRQSVANNTRFDAFRLGECLLAGKTGECLKVASGLKRTGVAIQAVTGALYYQLNQLNAVREDIRSGESEARALTRQRVFNMAQPLFRQALQRLSDQQMSESFRAMAQIDKQSKGRAAGDPWQTLDQMLLVMCTATKNQRASLKSYS
jgi:DNA polymerase-3 subunit delta